MVFGTVFGSIGRKPDRIITHFFFNEIGISYLQYGKVCTRYP